MKMFLCTQSCANSIHRADMLMSDAISSIHAACPCISTQCDQEQFTALCTAAAISARLEQHLVWGSLVKMYSTDTMWQQRLI